MSADHVSLDGIAVVASIHYVDRIEILERISPLHVWTDDTVHKRFHYRKPGLWVLGVRIFRRESPWRIRVTPEQLGCKSWLPLAEALSTEPASPVLEDAVFRAQINALTFALDKTVEIPRLPASFSDSKSDRP